MGPAECGGDLNEVLARLKVVAGAICIWLKVIGACTLFVLVHYLKPIDFITSCTIMMYVYGAYLWQLFACKLFLEVRDIVVSSMASSSILKQDICLH